MGGWVGLVSVLGGGFSVESGLDAVVVVPVDVGV